MNLIAATQMGGSTVSPRGSPQAPVGSQDGAERTEGPQNGAPEANLAKTRNIQNFHSIINYLRNTRSIQAPSNSALHPPSQPPTGLPPPSDSQMAETEQPRGTEDARALLGTPNGLQADHFLKSAAILD